MLRYKTTLVLFALLVAFCLPQTLNSCPGLNLVAETASGSTSPATFSVVKDDMGPGKKRSKKKMRHFLDRKTKMKKGRSCPSF